jgi:hypothetical protein
LPAQDHSVPSPQGELPWTEHAGVVAWYLYEVETGNIVEEPTQIAALIRSTPETSRHCVIEKQALAEIRGKIERHIKNTYLKSVQAPIDVKPALKAWMELT